MSDETPIGKEEFILMMESMERRLLTEMQELKVGINNNNRAIRGSNGDLGVLGRIIQIETSCSARQQALAMQKQFEEEKNVNWIQVTKEIMLPVILSIMGSVITAILLHQTLLSQ
jgi:hypothetical protein